MSHATKITLSYPYRIQKKTILLSISFFAFIAITMWSEAYVQKDIVLLGVCVIAVLFVVFGMIAIIVDFVYPQSILQTNEGLLIPTKRWIK